MKEFPKQFRDIVKLRKRDKFRIKIKKNELQSICRNAMMEYNQAIYKITVIDLWAQYMSGINKDNLRSSFKGFMIRLIGQDFSLIRKNGVYPIIESYIKDFIPSVRKITDINKIEFPYKNIGILHLIFVATMDERLGLLKVAEERNMSYIDFVNYVGNYIGHMNDIFLNDNPEIPKNFCLYEIMTRRGRTPAIMFVCRNKYNKNTGETEIFETVNRGIYRSIVNKKESNLKKLILDKKEKALLDIVEKIYILDN